MLPADHMALNLEDIMPELVNKQMCDFLDADPSIWKIRFTMGGLTIDPQGYRQVRDAIHRERIRCVVKAEMLDGDVGASYMPKYDVMVLRSASFNDAILASYIVHESTHALMDINKCNTTSPLDAEVAAYIAQAVYFRARFDLTSNRISTTLNIKADEVVTRRDMIKKAVALEPADYWPLKQAILQDPRYRGSINRASKDDGLNRVKCPWLDT